MLRYSSRKDCSDPDWAWHINWSELLIEWYDENDSTFTYQCKLCGCTYIPNTNYDCTHIFEHFMQQHNEVLVLMRLGDSGYSPAEARTVSTAPQIHDDSYSRITAPLTPLR